MRPHPPGQVTLSAILLGSCLAASGYLPAPACAATFGTHAQVNFSPDGTSFEFYGDGGLAGQTRASANQTIGSRGDPYFAFGSALALYDPELHTWRLGVQAGVELTGYRPGVYGDGAQKPVWAFAQFYDTLKVNVPDPFLSLLPGGFARLTFDINGAGTSTADRLGTLWGGVGAFRATTDNFNAPEIAGFNLNGVRHVVDLPLSGPTWQTLPLYVGFEAMIMLEDTNLDDPYSFYAEAQFGDTAKLAGIVIIDANGNPIPGATISADSGQQYPASPIPEPGTHALLFAGLTLLGWQARPRKQRIA